MELSIVTIVALIAGIFGFIGILIGICFCLRYFLFVFNSKYLKCSKKIKERNLMCLRLYLVWFKLDKLN